LCELVVVEVPAPVVDAVAVASADASVDEDAAHPSPLAAISSTQKKVARCLEEIIRPTLDRGNLVFFAIRE
jgi:hypothetical protein